MESKEELIETSTEIKELIVTDEEIISFPLLEN